jgi:geranylgeranyl pyrophosphate synthase
MSSPDLDETGAAEVARVAVEHGGVAFARQRARGYADRALELLDDFEDGPIRATLKDAVEYVLERRQ